MLQVVTSRVFKFPVAIVAVLGDLHKKLEDEFADRTRELRNTEERFNQYSKISSEWVQEIDTEDRFVFLSSHLHEATGLSPYEILGRKHQDLRAESYDTVENENWIQHIRCIELRDPFTNFEYQVNLPNGKERSIRASDKPYYDNDGNYLGYRELAVDATEEIK